MNLQAGIARARASVPALASAQHKNTQTSPIGQKRHTTEQESPANPDPVQSRSRTETAVGTNEDQVRTQTGSEPTQVRDQQNKTGSSSLIHVGGRNLLLIQLLVFRSGDFRSMTDPSGSGKPHPGAPSS